MQKIRLIHIYNNRENYFMLELNQIVNRKKTILQINTVINSGSTGHIAEEIGQIVINNGWNSYIAYGRNDRHSKSDKIKIGNNLYTKFHGIATRLFDRHGLASTKATKQLIDKIDEIKPNIIHLHNIHGYYLNYKILFEYLNTASVHVVWTLHDCWPFTGHCVYFTYAQCDKWKTECFECPQKKKYPASFFIDRSRNNYRDKKECFLSVENKLTLILVSDWLANLCAQSFFKDTSTKIIHNGIDTNIFKPISSEDKKSVFIKYNINAPYLVLGVANAWSQRKGFADFIKLRSLLSKEYSILLVGLSKEQIQSLPQGVIGVLRTENVNELAEIYAAADVFLNLSVEETFGLTTIESLSSGTPAIVYNSSASPELIAQGTGFVVNPQDFSMIKIRLDEIKEYGKKKYSTACREHIMKHFRKEDRYNEYLQLYTEVIKKN